MTVTMAQSAVLEAGATAARSARQRARLACDGITSQELAHDVAVVVSELVTNAVRHGGGEVRLDLRVDPGEVFVAVRDAGRCFDWTQEDAHPGALNGRGLGIVAGLAASWGVRNVAGTGKAVWCVLQTPVPSIVGGLRHNSLDGR